MHRFNDPAYYAARLRAEREAAAAATCEAARIAHLELASQYQQLLDTFGRPKLIGDSGELDAAGSEPGPSPTPSFPDRAAAS